jgi:hypothetical protein
MVSLFNLPDACKSEHSQVLFDETSNNAQGQANWERKIHSSVSASHELNAMHLLSRHV